MEAFTILGGRVGRALHNLCIAFSGPLVGDNGMARFRVRRHVNVSRRNAVDGCFLTARMTGSSAMAGAHISWAHIAMGSLVASVLWRLKLFSFFSWRVGGGCCGVLPFGEVVEARWGLLIEIGELRWA